MVHRKTSVETYSLSFALRCYFPFLVLLLSYYEITCAITGKLRGLQATKAICVS